MGTWVTLTLGSDEVQGGTYYQDEKNGKGERDERDERDVRDVRDERDEKGEKDVRDVKVVNHWHSLMPDWIQRMPRRH